MIKQLIHKCFGAFGLDLIHAPRDRFPHADRYPLDFTPQEIDIIEKVRPWTLTGPERIYALINATCYISKSGIPGAIVECGVWKGGSIAAVALALKRLNDVSRDLYLFDTFEGMPSPGPKDVDFAGRQAARVMQNDPKARCADAPLEGVRRVMSSTGYPDQRVHFIQGRVEETIPGKAPDSIALLRLDTDWYESTRHELTHLFPRVCRGGVIVIDDYGHWEGCRQACCEYFDENQVQIFLNRIDYTGRIAIKT